MKEHPERGPRRDATETLESSGVPRVWVLLGPHKGDDAQVLSLANSLPWDIFEKPLKFNWLAERHGLFHRATLRSLVPELRASLAPPWPDLVIAAGKRSAAIALWIKAQSGGHARLVQIGRPCAPLGKFDLVVTTPQYRLPSQPNVIELSLPLVRGNAHSTSDWLAEFDHLPRPWTAVLIGGSSRPFVLDKPVALNLCADLNHWSETQPGSLLVSTSPRTNPEVVGDIRANLKMPFYLYSWNANTPNPYQAILALSDGIIVTGESVSMLADGCATGKPVAIWPVPQKPGWWDRLAQVLTPDDYNRFPWGPLWRWMTIHGLLWPQRAVPRLTERAISVGLAARFDRNRPLEPPSESNQSEAEKEEVLRKIESLLTRD